MKTELKRRTTAHDFTPDEVKELQRMAYATWEYLAPDALRSLAECGERAEMTRAHVVEMVLDADYMESMFRSHAQVQLLKRFRKVEYRVMCDIVRPAFPYARYV